MELISSIDVMCFKAVLTAGTLYSAASVIGKLRSSAAEPLIPATATTDVASRSKPLTTPSRSVRKLLEDRDKRCVVLYGSETGTAARLATCFVRDANAQYGLGCLALNLDDCDYDDLATLGHGYTIVLLLATAGEGDPAANAARFTKYLLAISDRTKYQSLRYAAFGLGSSSYRLFNQAIKTVDEALDNLGALRLGDVGLGDDGKGTLDDDYLNWSNHTLQQIAKELGLERQNRPYEPILRIEERAPQQGTAVLDGEPNKAQLYGKVKGPFTASNPYPAPVRKYYQLASAKCERKCTHIEFDTNMSTLTYSTGDHLAVTPVNSEPEVERFLRIFGLSEKASTSIDVTSSDATVQSPFPSPTTYRAAVSKYMNICGPVSRQTLSTMAELTAIPQAKEAIHALAKDADLFTNFVRRQHLNLAQTVETFAPAGAFQGVNFAALLELLGPLKPRYYSISSSNAVSKKTISITVVEERKQEQDWPYEFRGVSTGYLSDMLCATDPASERRVRGPQGIFDKPTAYIHVRRSQFRLPRRPETPVVMIGPGTGVAPFRAFVHERADASRRGYDIGKTVLFYGCRRPDEDLLYADEWRDLADAFKQDTFQMYTAFSRVPGSPKAYVQDKLREQAHQIRELILRQGAYVYVCGNASRMAKGVHATILEILAEDPAFIGENETAAGYLETMRGEKRWQEDVW